MVGIAVASCLKFFRAGRISQIATQSDSVQIDGAFGAGVGIRYDRAAIRWWRAHAKGTKRSKPDRHLAWHLLLSDPPCAGVVRGDADRDRKCGKRHHP